MSGFVWFGKAVIAALVPLALYVNAGHGALLAGFEH